MNSGAQLNLSTIRGLSSSLLQERSEHSFFLFYYYRMEDEAVLDRGASFLKHVCDEEEVEGKSKNLSLYFCSIHIINVSVFISNKNALLPSC